MVTEAFSFLTPLLQIPGIRAEWVERDPSVEIHGDRDAAMRQLRPAHEARVREFAGPHARWWRAEQVHGKEVAAVPAETADEITAPDGLPVVAGVDGLITAKAGQLLSIYVADCGAIWLADRRTKAVGLLHSGKKGTECNIFAAAIGQMEQRFGSRPQDIIAVLGPCIRPPHYEVDFAATIGHQAEQSGLGQFLDCGLNTASDLRRYYSYRMEHGQTGRMMAMIIRDA